MPQQMVRTTLTLPAELLSAVDDAVRKGRARNRGELISAAVRHELAMREPSAIDRAFITISDDEVYVKEAEELTQESMLAGWEALREGRQQFTGRDDASRWRIRRGARPNTRLGAGRNSTDHHRQP